MKTEDLRDNDLDAIWTPEAFWTPPRLHTQLQFHIFRGTEFALTRGLLGYVKLSQETRDNI